MIAKFLNIIALACALAFADPVKSQVDQSQTITNSSSEPAESSERGRTSIDSYRQRIEPILRAHCFECHSGESKSGNLSFDSHQSDREQLDPKLWLKVLQNLRAGIMPPQGHERLAKDELGPIESWIKNNVFALEHGTADPGRVTVRRLNRTEYKNAIRDLLGVNIDTSQMLPADDVGYGFDNIGDVMSISPLRLEKFIEAAITVVDQGVPKDTVMIPSNTYYPEDFIGEDRKNADHMSFYQDRTVKKKVSVPHAGEYRIHIFCKIDGDASPRDPQECRVHISSDGNEFFTEQYHWADNDWFENDCVINLEQGDHVIEIRTEVLHPELKPLRTKMEYRLVSLRIDGPADRTLWINPQGYDKIYSRAKPPQDLLERREYANEVLERFASKAFRRPISKETLEKLVGLSETIYTVPGVTFEEGIAQAMVAILASPKFLFHLEESISVSSSRPVEQLDETSLAARLSFALWRSIPDEELNRLATTNQLRKNFDTQVRRMLADPKSEAFVEGFANQWLQTNSIIDIPINSESIMAQEKTKEPVEVANVEGAANISQQATSRTPGAGAPPPGFLGRRGPVKYTGRELTPVVRQAMKKEVEAYFGYVMREDRSLLDFLESDYTFVNAPLATLYDIPGVEGTDMRKVVLPQNSPRGGILTMGSVLTVTSNPTRTSPVKRGKWVLENILGAPTAPPPPDIPALEDSAKSSGDGKPTQREVLAIHRESALCASCHSRMDPLGLALENFNGFGRFRSIEFEQPIDPAGELFTGESFAGVTELKQALVQNHKMEFYRTITSKLLTYVLGRGIEYYDIAVIDDIVEKLDNDNGRFSTLITSVLESKPVHLRRSTSVVDSTINSENASKK